jgi:hypothetical protein
MRSFSPNSNSGGNLQSRFACLLIIDDYRCAQLWAFKVFTVATFSLRGLCARVIFMTDNWLCKFGGAESALLCASSFFYKTDAQQLTTISKLFALAPNPGGLLDGSLNTCHSNSTVFQQLAEIYDHPSWMEKFRADWEWINWFTVHSIKHESPENNQRFMATCNPLLASPADPAQIREWKHGLFVQSICISFGVRVQRNSIV